MQNRHCIVHRRRCVDIRARGSVNALSDGLGETVPLQAVFLLPSVYIDCIKLLRLEHATQRLDLVIPLPTIGKVYDQRLSVSGLCGALPADSAQPVLESSPRSSGLGTQLPGPRSYRALHLWQCKWSQAAANSEHSAGIVAVCCCKASVLPSNLHLSKGSVSSPLIASRNATDLMRSATQQSSEPPNASITQHAAELGLIQAEGGLWKAV